MDSHDKGQWQCALAPMDKFACKLHGYIVYFFIDFFNKEQMLVLFAVSIVQVLN